MLKQVQHNRNIFPKRTYSSINLFSYSPRKRCAFTLAEILITLGIVGVVAALTMPALIQNHQRIVLQNQLKKFASTINGAYNRAVAEYGASEYWNVGLYQHHEILDFLETTDITKSIPESFKEDMTTALSQINVRQPTFNNTFQSSKFYLLKDGSMIFDITPSYNEVSYFIADINGPGKKPNRFGKDLWVFLIVNRIEDKPHYETSAKLYKYYL